MREKLLELMKREGLKSGQLAEMLGINPAAISHILAGRNKPGFDLLQKILRRFPRIDPDWLLLDSPVMYRTDTAPSQVTAAPADNTEEDTFGGFKRISGDGLSGNLFSASRQTQPVHTNARDFGNAPTTRNKNATVGTAGTAVTDADFARGSAGSFVHSSADRPIDSGSGKSIDGNIPDISGTNRAGEHLSHSRRTNVARIVIFYEDATFESFLP